MKRVSFFSFHDAPVSLKSDWVKSVEETISSGVFIGGNAVTHFENKFCSYLGVKFATGVGNGYDALFIALKALDVGPGDLVAVPSHTFIATWLSVNATGATPFAIDCDKNGLMDLDLLENSNKEFKAIIPVHMHGQMVNMSRLMNWAKKEGSYVIEDCAQSHGAELLGRKSGSWGDFGAFSFYPTKNLGALGDGGAITSNNQALMDKARSLANYGSSTTNRYDYINLGLNSRLDAIQAGILSYNLDHLDLWNSKRKKIASEYIDALKPNGINCINNSDGSVFHHFAITSQNRDNTKNILKEFGVETQIHYPETAECSFAKISGANSPIEGKNALQLSKNILSLPISPWLSNKEIDYVIDTIKSPRVLSTILGSR